MSRSERVVRALLTDAPVACGVIAVRGPGLRIDLPFGTRSDTGEPASAHDRFEIGSVSKTVTALVAARLADEGRVDLDAPVRARLPWLPLPHDSDEVSLRHLLAHTAGWIAGQDALPGDVAQALLLGESRAGAPAGARFHYSNIGYVVAGLALASATGRPFPDVVRERLLEPLGLGGALASITGAERAFLTPGTVPLRDDAPWRPGDPSAPASWLEPAGADGNVAATAGELAEFARLLADTESLSGGEWFARAVATVASPAAPAGEDILRVGRHLRVDDARYGLGVNVEETPFGTLLTHGGGMVGYGAFMLAHPALRTGVGVLLSGPGERPYAEWLAREVHAELLPPAAAFAISGGGGDTALGPADPSAIARSLIPERPPLSPGRGDSAAFTGEYRSYSPWFPHLEIGVSDDGGLVLRAYAGVEAPMDDVPLIPLPGDGHRFRIGADPALPEQLEFLGVVDGRAQLLSRDGCRYARVAPRER